MWNPLRKKEFYPFIQSVPNVIECNCVTGDYSMLIQVAYQSTVELDHFINVLQRFGHTKTLIVFSHICRTQGYCILSGIYCTDR
ncbi:MAG: Lrp/AsnC ligand binding domain-containing protein [Lachnospiraceae bacterium]